MATIGSGLLLFLLFASLYAVAAFLFGIQRDANSQRGTKSWIDSGRRAMLVTGILASLALAILLLLLLTQDFSVRYVYNHVSDNQSTLYTISALWAGQEGSLLLWLWVLAMLSAFVAWPLGEIGPTWRWTLIILALLQAFLAVLLLWPSDPFIQLDYVPQNGIGLNPLLQNIWMIAHPPLVFVAYVLYGIAFALALGALISGQMDRAFWERLERWNLWAWLFLGGGILLGSWWAYIELGWGGYWGWDPVENASLLPWLTGTALLHAGVMRRRRGLSRGWILTLTAVTFVLCLFATFVTRSGLIESVHAFAQSSIGYLFLGIMAISLAASGILLYQRRRLYTTESPLVALNSREIGFLLTNVVLCSLAGVVLFGILFPNLAAWFGNDTIVLNTDFYGRVTTPLFVILAALLALCPLTRWRVALGKRGRLLLGPLALTVGVEIICILWGIRHPLALLLYGLATLIIGVLALVWGRDVYNRHRDEQSWLAAMGATFRARRRHYGAHIVHLSIALILLGVTSSSFFGSEHFLELQEGESATIETYTLTYREGIQERKADQLQQKAIIELSRQGRHLNYLVPEKNLHTVMGQWVSEVALHISLREDVYLILGQLDAENASLQILLNPLVVWIWIGGGLLLLGTGIVLVGQSGRKTGQDDV